LNVFTTDVAAVIQIKEKASQQSVGYVKTIMIKSITNLLLNPV